MISPTALLVGIVMTALIQVCVSVIDINGIEKEAQRGEIGEVDELGNREREREREGARQIEGQSAHSSTTYYFC